MKESRFTEEQIIGVLRKAEAGMPVKELCRQASFPLTQDRHDLAVGESRRPHRSLPRRCGSLYFQTAPLARALTNRAIATLRYKVEQGFGMMKRRFHLGRAWYFGAAETQAPIAWAALGLNLLEAMRKLQSGRLQPCAGRSPA